MYTKLFTLLLMVCLIGTLSETTANDRTRSVKIVRNGEVFRGETGPVVYGPPAPQNLNFSRIPTVSVTTSAGTVTTSEVSTDARTHYDLQANGNIRYIYQNPSNPNIIHAVFMVSTDPAPGWDNRNARYFYSTDAGNTWSYIGTVTATRSGFPSLTVTNDDRAVILAHSTETGGLNRTYLSVDLAPGVGSWSVLDPGSNGNAALAPIWPEVAIDLTNNKVLFAASQNGVDSCFVNVATNLTSPGTFVGYKPVPNGETAEGYNVAVGTGKYGVAFNNLSGGAALIESNDGGVTWGAPTTIWTWSGTDSVGTIRSIDLRYNGSTPQVALGLCRVDPVAGTFSPGLPAKVVFWSPAVNGGVPVTIDSADGLNGSNPINDVFVSVTRCAIGGFGTNGVYIAYSKSSNDTDAAGNNFFNTWGRWSGDNGATWGPVQQLTNLAGQFNNMHDCRYVGISPTNAGNRVNLITQADTIPASNVNGAAESWAKMLYIRVDNVIGINQIGTEVPKGYSLEQNYPNPFNPTTKIKFAIPTSGLVTLKVYDILGKQVGVLVNKQLTSGTYEYEFSAIGLTSGVYFYKLEAGNFTDTKRLVLVK